MATLRQGLVDNDCQSWEDVDKDLPEKLCRDRILAAGFDGGLPDNFVQV